MKEIYVHILRYHKTGWGNRQSRIMVPLSYGPFQDEDAAREWIRQHGITRATKLMAGPAAENLKISEGQLAISANAEQPGLDRLRAQQYPVA